MSPEYALAFLVGAAILAVLVFVVLPARADRRKRERERRLMRSDRGGRDRWQNPAEHDDRLEPLASRRQRNGTTDNDSSGSDSGGDGGGGGD